MAGIVTNIIQNSLSGFVNGAVSTAGGYAGSAVNGLGSLIENAGDAVGNGSTSSPPIKTENAHALKKELTTVDVQA
jgi:hypothetical protein